MHLYKLTDEQLLQELIRTLPEKELATLTAIAAFTSARGEGRPDIFTIVRFAKAFGAELCRVAPFFGYVLRSNPRRWVDVAKGAQAPASLSAVSPLSITGLFAYCLLGGYTAFTGNAHMRKMPYAALFNLR